MHYPVLEKYVVTQDFGITDYAQEKGQEIYYFFDGKHPGLDFAMPEGEPVFAALPGFVTSIEYHRGMGKVIRVRYGNIQHIYGHLSKFKVDFGDFIEEGQEIALSGSTVDWSGPHLHFEVRDLTVYEVSDRPFQPKFGTSNPSQFKDTFTYEVSRNQALIDLALKFFGSEKGIAALRNFNPELQSTHTHQILPAKTKVHVPLR